MQTNTGKLNHKAKILQPTPENLALVVNAILHDEVVGMPTETVYGLAGNAFSPTSLARIFKAKERPTFDPLIVHVSLELGQLRTTGIDQLKNLQLIQDENLTSSQKSILQILMQEFWPGPLTLVLPKHPRVPDLATSGLPTVAIRMPSHPVARSLISLAKTPLAAPSANRFGRISPTSPQAVVEELGDQIHWVLEGGICEVGIESTILGFSEQNEIILLRPGGIPPEKIEQTIGTSLVQYHSSRAQLTPPLAQGDFGSTALKSPGLLESHYAPSRPLRLLPKPISALQAKDKDHLFAGLDPIPCDANLGLILISGDPLEKSRSLEQWIGRPVIGRTLSLSGDLIEAARNLFSMMRELDSEKLGIATILVEPCLQPQGLGYAIMDRLKRASSRKI